MHYYIDIFCQPFFASMSGTNMVGFSYFIFLIFSSFNEPVRYKNCEKTTELDRGQNKMGGKCLA